MANANSTRPTGPAVLLLFFLVVSLMTRSTRGRRSVSYAARAWSRGRSRRHRARTMALSMASEAPCPELEGGACAASPVRPVRPGLHAGTRDIVSIDPTYSRAPGGEWLITREAGVRS